MNFFILLWDIICHFFEVRTEKAQEAWNENDWLTLILNILLIILATVFGIGTPLFLIYRFRHAIIAMLLPIFLLASVIYSCFDHQKKPKLQQPTTLDEVKDEAEEIYPMMNQAAFIIISELCGYLPGLVAPTSVASIRAQVRIDIRASMTAVYHFTVWKGTNGEEKSTIQEILETIISQHLQAQDLPLSVPEFYTAEDGSIWPGLVVDGIHDFNKQYQVDLVITNEAEVKRLKRKRNNHLSGSVKGSTPHDPDFD